MWREFLIYIIFGIVCTIIMEVVNRRTRAMDKKKRNLMRFTLWLITIVVFALILTMVHQGSSASNAL